MVTLQFDDAQLHKLCCDPTAMRHRFGKDTSRRISRRLQQLEAMTSLADLQFLPFVSREADDGVEIAIADDLVLVIAPTQPKSGVPTMNHTIVTIRALRASSVVTT